MAKGTGTRKTKAPRKSRAVKSRAVKVPRPPYRHLLVATDGSEIAARGVKAGMALARALGARVHGLYVRPRAGSATGGVEGGHGGPLLIEHFEQVRANEALGKVEAAAKRAGVACRVEALEAGPAWEGIVSTARKRRCDLVVLASHGRGLLGTLLHGSETVRVLSRSELPVLVIR